MSKKDLHWEQAEFPINLTELLEEIDFNKPSTIPEVFTKVAQVAVQEKQPAAKATGVVLKYLGDVMECAIVDAERQGIKPGSFANGFANAVGIAFGFLAMGLSADSEQYAETRESLTDTMRESCYAFAIPHPDSKLVGGGHRHKADTSVPSVAMRIDAPGTVH